MCLCLCVHFKPVRRYLCVVLLYLCCSVWVCLCTQIPPADYCLQERDEGKKKRALASNQPSSSSSHKSVAESQSSPKVSAAAAAAVVAGMANFRATFLRFKLDSLYLIEGRFEIVKKCIEEGSVESENLVSVLWAF